MLFAIGIVVVVLCTIIGAFLCTMNAEVFCTIGVFYVFFTIGAVAEVSVPFVLLLRS